MFSVRLARIVCVWQFFGVLVGCCSAMYFFGASDPVAVEDCVIKLTLEGDNDARAENKAALCADLGALRRLDIKTHTDGWNPAGKSIITNLHACLKKRKSDDSLQAELFDSSKAKYDAADQRLIEAIGDLMYARNAAEDECDEEAGIGDGFRFSENFNPINDKILTRYREILEKCVSIIVHRNDPPPDSANAAQNAMCVVDPKVPKNKVEEAAIAASKSRLADMVQCVLNKVAVTKAFEDGKMLLDDKRAVVFVQGLCEAKKKKCTPESYQQDLLCKEFLDYLIQKQSTDAKKVAELAKKPKPKYFDILGNLLKFRDMLNGKTAAGNSGTLKEAAKEATIAGVKPNSALASLEKFGVAPKKPVANDAAMKHSATAANPIKTVDPQTDFKLLFTNMLTKSMTDSS